jgi:hypothetical protein
MGINYTKPMADIDAQMNHEAIVTFLWVFGIAATIFSVIINLEAVLSQVF